MRMLTEKFKPKRIEWLGAAVTVLQRAKLEAHVETFTNLTASCAALQHDNETHLHVVHNNMK